MAFRAQIGGRCDSIGRLYLAVRKNVAVRDIDKYGRCSVGDDHEICNGQRGRHQGERGRGEDLRKRNRVSIRLKTTERTKNPIGTR
jgi:hypothetical protein